MKKPDQTDLENKYHAFIEQAADALLVHDFQGRFVEVNRRACDILGYTREELLNMSVTDVEQDFNLKSAQAEWSKIKEREYFTLYGHQKRKDGTVFPVEIRFGLFILSGEKYFMGLVRDITAQKAAEEKIRNEEKKYRTTLDNILEGCQIIDFDWRYIYLNDSADKHNRRPKHELLGKKYTDMWPGVERTEVYAKIKHCLEKRISYQFENKFIFPDGSPGWFELSIQPVPEGVFILSYDITSRKEAERALQENEKRLRFALEGTNDGIWDVQMKTGKCYLSPRGCEILGYTFAELPQIEKQWRDMVNSEDIHGTLNNLENHISGKSGLFEVEQRIRTKSGEWKWVLTRGKVVERDSDGNPLRMTGTLTDISEQKSAKEALHESRERFYSLFENSFDAIMLTVTDGTVLSANPAACRMFQRTEEEICKLSPIALVDVTDTRLNKFLKERNDFGRTKGELTFVRKDGTKFEGEITSSIFADKYGAERTSVIIRDISERKKSEDILIQSEKKYKYLFDNNPFPMWIYDLETLRFLEVNEAAVSHYGYTREEFLKMTLKDIRPEEDIKRLLKDVEDTKDILNFAGNWRHRLKNGNIIFVEIVSHLVDFENRPARLALANDITEKIQTQEELKESEEKYRTLIEIFSDAVFINHNNKIVYANNSARKLFGAKTDNELIGISPFKVFHPDFHPLMKQRIETLLEGKTGVTAAEEQIVRLDGKIVDVEVTATPFILKGQKAIQVVLRDITERKRSEEVLKKLTERFNLATEAAQIGVWDWDIRGDNLLWDNRMYELYGINKEVFPEAYNAWLNGIHPDDRESSNEFSQKAIKGDIDYDTEFRVLWPDGSVHWLKANGKVFRDEKGVALRMVGINYEITERKQAEESLIVNEERFRHVTDCSGVWVWETDKDGIYTYVSPMEENILGYKVDELIGKKHFYDFFIPEVKMELKAAAMGVFERKENFRNFENANIHKEGYVVYLETSGLPMHDEHGNFIGYRGADRDITPQRLAVEALKKSEESLRQAQHLAKIGNWEYNPKNGNAVMSRECFNIFELDENLHSDKLFEIAMEKIHPEDRVILEELMNSAIKKDAGFNFEYRVVFPEGKIKHISGVGKAIENNNGEIINLRGIIQDITERKKSEEKLNEALYRFETIIRTSPQAIIVVDTEGAVILWNNSAEQIFGWNAEEVIGKTNPIIPEDMLEEVYDVKVRVLKGMTVKGIETQRLNKNGNRIDVSFSATPYRDGQGEIAGILALVEDITERKKAEQEIKKLNEELEQRVIERTSQLEEANKELEAFSYSVSHDLRAPLRAISGFSKIITEDYSAKLDDEGREYLNDIISNSVRMSKLIDDLLELSRFGRKQITRTHINMKELFADVCADENSLLEKKAKIKISKLHDAFGDFNLIKQVAVNLISNALKYSSKETNAVISVSSETLGNDIIYCIKDNGVGFNMAYAHKLFGVFQRLHSLEDFEGTGVGLAIVQRIVLRHNGKVWAESEEGKGAAFYFSLPLK
ncbi:MAG: PAS domain S-box protein [Ignavibacteria bacterium]|nr:PAS domain S-box protein [Ignavibacteria bacterium]